MCETMAHVRSNKDSFFWLHSQKTCLANGYIVYLVRILPYRNKKVTDVWFGTKTDPGAKFKLHESARWSIRWWTRLFQHLCECWSIRWWASLDIEVWSIRWWTKLGVRSNKGLFSGYTFKATVSQLVTLCTWYACYLIFFRNL